MLLSELRAYRDKAARIVQEHGEVYLPVFLRLEHEIAVRESSLERTTIYTLESGTPDGTPNGTHTRHHQSFVNR